MPALHLVNYGGFKQEIRTIKLHIVEKFSDYLAGGQFTVLTDNNLIICVLITKQLEAPGQRRLWALRKTSFHDTYRSGLRNAEAYGMNMFPHERMNAGLLKVKRKTLKANFLVLAFHVWGS